MLGYPKYHKRNLHNLKSAQTIIMNTMNEQYAAKGAKSLFHQPLLRSGKSSEVKGPSEAEVDNFGGISGETAIFGDRLLAYTLLSL